jgi:hypothetical protein
MTHLKLITWNIWMMPAWTHTSPRNEARARAIGQELLACDYDILCLEKAFDGGARDVLSSVLGAKYPHRYGPVNESGSPFKINGGVWVLSTRPLSGYREIQFDESTGIESFSRKGAMRLEGRAGDRPFYLVATHLQGESGPTFDADHQKIRNAQIEQIARELVAPVSQSDPTYFFCGDFCTPRRVENSPYSETPDYQRMLQTLGATNGDEDRVTLDDRLSHNDLATDNKGRVAELDYILLRAGRGPPIVGTWERVVFRRGGWDDERNRQDLSYRFAVSASFNFPS